MARQAIDTTLDIKWEMTPKDAVLNELRDLIARAEGPVVDGRNIAAALRYVQTLVEESLDNKTP
jgi:hypothetical protein